MSAQYYDIVGDIHGHEDALRRLLNELDYTVDQGAFRHAERKMIFVGDFIDRGPEQRQVLQIARAMCQAGTAIAILGNHEFNAIGWATPDGNGGFLRTQSEEHEEQHKEFLQQLGEGSADYLDTIQWFRKLSCVARLSGLSCGSRLLARAVTRRTSILR
jgi:Calcineurin-like phosphoesterase